jgi:hypothetical protein
MAKIEQIKTAEEMVEDLFKEGSKELQTELTAGMVKKIKVKMIERTTASKVLQNIEREIDMMKIELTEEIKSLSM